jgi:hypothetical protein
MGHERADGHLVLVGRDLHNRRARHCRPRIARPAGISRAAIAGFVVVD